MLDRSKKLPETKDLSVIVCTRDRAHILGATINAILCQLTRDDELIIVDNGSVDNTKEIVESIASGDKMQYIYYVGPGKTGKSATRNRGIEAARGKYIAFLDDDAIPVEGWRANVKEACRELPGDWGGLTGQVIPVIEGEIPYWMSRRDFSSVSSMVMRGASILNFTDNPLLVTANSVCRSEVLYNVNGFSEIFDIFGGYGEDADLAHKIVSNGYKLFYHPSVKVNHHISLSRFTRDSLMKRRYLGAIGECVISMKYKSDAGRFIFVGTQFVLRPVYVILALILMIIGKVRGSERDVTYAKTRIARSRGFIYASIMAVRLGRRMRAT